MPDIESPLAERTHLTDVAGAFGAIVAALCCAGTPIIVAALAATGFSAVRKDAILWPVMLASLVVAIWGYWRGYRVHRGLAPLVVGIAGALSLALGVIVIHGFPAMQMIYGGAVLLIVATILNVVARKRRRQFLVGACGFTLALSPRASQRAQGGEAREIAASGGVVSRKSDTLVIRIQGHAALRLVNRPSTPESGIEFTYAGRIPGTAYHVVHVHYWETGDIVVVDAESGDTVHMVARPILSPSGRFAVASIYDMSGSAESLNSIELWRMKPSPARAVWRVDMAPADRIDKWGASVDGWLGDSIVRLTRHIVIAGKAGARGVQPERRAAARLVRFGTTWRLDTLTR